MSEATRATGTPANAVTAGQLLREARQAQGLHIAALASAIKVTPKKLELLEADRFDELPDTTFTRALAQTVCRSLKIDAAPVLALLPPSRSHRLEKAGGGLNTRYRERPSRLDAGDGAGWGKLAVWAPALLLVAAAAIYFMPASWLPFGLGQQQAVPEVDPAASGAAALFPPAVPAAAGSDSSVPAGAPVPADAAASAGLIPSSTTAPLSALPAGAGAAAADPVGASAASATTDAAPAATATLETPKLLRLRAAADSWIQVSDATGQALLGRVVKAGETVELEGAAPLKLRIGNAAATQVIFRGEALPLGEFTRNNLASLELQ